MQKTFSQLMKQLKFFSLWFLLFSTFFSCRSQAQTDPAIERANRAAQLLDSLLEDDEHLDILDIDHLVGMRQEFVKTEEESSFPFLPSENSEQSVSIGTVTEGYLIGSMSLPMPGRTYGVLARQLRRDLIYGTNELIEGIISASEYVDSQFPRSVLWLGNIGAKHGGDISYSVSHNAGRDADLAFYTTTPDGEHIQPPALLHYRDNGRTVEYNGYYRFDVPRNWALVKGLINAPNSEIQYLFISNGLRRLLLNYAQSQDESEELIARARVVLYQPGRLPHDDHLHIRIYCPQGDVGGGCVNFGRYHSGVQRYRSEPQSIISEATSMLRNPDPDVRIAAIRRLALLDATGQIDAINRRFSDPSPMVRAAAATGLGQLVSRNRIGVLIQRWEEEEDFSVRIAIIHAIGEVGGRDAGNFIASILAEPELGVLRGQTFDLRLIAATVSARMARAEPMPALIELLQSEQIELRDRSAFALQMITNHRESEIYWRATNVSQEQLQNAQLSWQNWLENHRNENRSQWLARGFANAGYEMVGRRQRDGAALARAAGSEHDWIRINAQRELIRITGNHARSLQWSPRDARAYWNRWVERHPRRL